jgi:hypothetical protein
VRDSQLLAVKTKLVTEYYTRPRPVVSSCELSDEHSGSMEGGKFVDSLSDY